MEWIEYEPGKSSDYIPMERWGRDHWSTFLYLETCAVDSRGIVDNRKMRCNPRLHRELANYHPSIGLMDGSEYPTILRDGQIEKHDDWSCLEDMIAAGLINAWWRVKYPKEIFGNSEAKVALTDVGHRIASQLRQHKANGGTVSIFSAEAQR